MPYLLLSIAIPLLLITLFIALNLYYDWKENKFSNSQIEKKYPDEVERLLSLDEFEINTYHKN